MRVHELAKELGVSSKEILSSLEELGVGGRTASSSVPEEALPRLRATGGKAKPGIKVKRAAKEATATEQALATVEGNGQVREIAPPAVEPAPAAEPAAEAPSTSGPTALKLSRGATPQDVAERTGTPVAEVVKTLIGLGEMAS